MGRSSVCVCAGFLAVAAALGAPQAWAAELHGAVDAGPAGDDETVGFEVYLPTRDPAGRRHLLEAQQDPASPEFRHWLTPLELRARFGPDPAAAGVRASLEEAGFAVADDLHGVRATGPAGSVTRFFGVQLHHVTTAEGRDRVVAAEDLRMPAELKAAGARIAAFDPFVRMHAFARQAAMPDNRTSQVGPYWAADLRQAYRAPSYTAVTGQGRTIGILMDADILDSDIKTYFTREGLTPPTVTRVEIDGGAGFDTAGSSEESTLDVQQSFGMAPGASIILYVLRDLSDESIMDGLNQAISDGKADIVSMSFGGCEAAYTAAYAGTDKTAILGEYETIFESGNLLGMTFVAASGDFGALECATPAYFNGGSGKYQFLAGASSPATAPAVTGVGGTNLLTSRIPGSKDSVYAGENASGDPLEPVYDPFSLGHGAKVIDGYWGSGGGPSIYFAAPNWQSLVATGNTSFRTTPDLSLHMGGCPVIANPICIFKARSSDISWFNGKKTRLIGTSASAPAFAGVLALMENFNGGTRLGNVNQTIYQLANDQANGRLRVFHQKIKGFNGLYYSKADGSAPYNMVLGNGTLDIRNFIGAQVDKGAGIPGSPSNP